MVAAAVVVMVVVVVVVYRAAYPEKIMRTSILL